MSLKNVRIVALLGVLILAAGCATPVSPEPSAPAPALLIMSDGTVVRT